MRDLVNINEFEIRIEDNRNNKTQLERNHLI